MQLENPNAQLRPGAVKVDDYKLRASSPLNQRGMGPYEYLAEGSSSGSDPADTLPSGTPSQDPVPGSPICADSSISMVIDSGFGNNGANWKHHNSGSGTFTTATDGTATVDILSAGDNIQLYQSGIALEAGQAYRLSFYAHSNSGHDLDVRMHQHESPHRMLGLDTTIDLGTEREYYSYDFTPQTSEVNSRLRLWLASHAQAGDSYTFDQVALSRIDASCAGDNDRTDGGGQLAPAVFLPFISGQ